MTHEEKKQIIEAAIAICEYCKSLKDCNELCLFYRKGDRCRLCPNPPEHWVLPKLTRWTPEDVALAKALKRFGADEIECSGDGIVNWVITGTCIGASRGELPFAAFRTINLGETLDLDTIIKEAEG